jgi:hypothetical protein
MESAEKKKLWIAGIIGLIAIFLYLSWIDATDGQRQIAADRYEACVNAKYGMNPTEWYAKHGSYPYCDANANAN